MTDTFAKAVFLDRDGTINNDLNGYISDPKDFQLFPYAAKAIRLLNELGFKTIVVTNQSGIARGLYTEKDLELVHKHMIDELTKENAIIDLILYSPYHKEGTVEPFNKEHISRKPNSGMFFDALKKYQIKAKASYMIGDRAADIEFGKNNGLITILVKTGYGAETWEARDRMKVAPDFVVENLFSAASLIKTMETSSVSFFDE